MKLFALMAVLTPLWSQPLTVYSDLARIDAQGNVTAPETPREILSPLVVRNGFTSFQVVVQAPAGKRWQLFIGQNPDNAVEVSLYREAGEQLERVAIPVAAEGTQVFWLDLWAAKDAPVARIKVEPELNIDDDWVIYPMEGRVTDAIVKTEKPFEPVLPAGDALWAALCRSTPPAAKTSVAYTLTAVRSRNLQQDAILAGSYGAGEDLKTRLGVCNPIPAANPEEYLKIRDYLFRLR